MRIVNRNNEIYQQNIDSSLISRCMINKAKSIRLNRNRIKSPSPDMKNSNIVQSTCSPIQQIQKFLAIGRQQAKLKQQASFNKFVPTSEKSDGSARGLSLQKQEIYKQRIKELEQQLQKQRSYTEQFDELAQKNNKLKDQMVFLLKQLEQRYDNREQAEDDSQHKPTPKQYRLPTLETSADHNSNNSSPTNIKRMQFSSSAQASVLPSSVTYLHEYIQKLQNTIHQLKDQISQLQFQIRKSVKKDMHQMEQRLMSYIFGLQERFNETNFRNQQIFKKIQNIKDSSRIYIQDTAKKETVGNFQVFQNTGKSRKQSDFDSNFFKLSASDGRREDSVISMMSKDIVLDPTSSLMNIGEQKTAKKQQHSLQNFNIQTKQCLKCLEYLKIIDRQSERIKRLQEQLLAQKTATQNRKNSLKVKPVQKPQSPVTSSLSSSLPLPSIALSLPIPGSPQIKQDTHSNFLQQIQEQMQSSREQNRSFNISQKWHNPHRESHINIVVDSSGESSFAVHDHDHDNRDDAHAGAPINTDDLRLSGKSHKSNELYKLEKVKDQLVNIMQEIQQLVHQCQTETNVDNSGRVGQLVKKVNQQASYIAELEEQISRLQLQIQINRTKRQEMQKFIRLQVKQQQQAQSPYFRPLKQPIDCVDHKGTKTKIDYIMKSIKMFERDRLEDNLQNKDRPQKGEHNTKTQKNSNVKQNQSRTMQKYADDSDGFIRIHTL